MKKVFFSGSASTKALPQEAIDIIRNLKDSEIIVGDCMGIDTAVQQEAMKYNIPVTVYCSGPKCRNCLNPMWNTNHIAANNLYGRAFYTAKDIAMANDCDEAVAIWDGISKGTSRNIEQCKSLGKNVTVINVPSKNKTIKPASNTPDTPLYDPFEDETLSATSPSPF